MGEEQRTMRRTLQFRVLLVLVVCGVGLQAADSAYSAALRSTLRVEDGRGRTLGAAVCLGGGVAVTAAHVVRDHKPFRVIGLGSKSDWQRVPRAVP